jgi:hypothetical protein
METEGSLLCSKGRATGPYPEPNLRAFVKFCNKLCFCGQDFMVPRQNPKLEDQPLSVVRDCLFNIFVAPLHIWRPSPPSAT